jgi:hypothetical protein
MKKRTHNVMDRSVETLPASSPLAVSTSHCLGFAGFDCQVLGMRRCIQGHDERLGAIT